MKTLKAGQKGDLRESIITLEGLVKNLETVIKMNMAEQKRVNEFNLDALKQLFDAQKAHALGIENIKGQLKQINDLITPLTSEQKKNTVDVENIKGQLKSTKWAGGFVSLATMALMALLAWWKK